nr:MAG TPA: hypothetical protein [Caudoviricetes sp.]
MCIILQGLRFHIKSNWWYNCRILVWKIVVLIISSYLYI